MSFVVHRVAKQAARYTDAGGREKCGYCRFFVAPRACGKVIGPVSPQGWCKYFSRQAVSLSGGGLAATAGGASFDQSFLTGSLGTGAVFTRASAGWYYNSSGVLVSAAVNAPRFDYDPVTLQPKGLLLEDTATNIALQSGDFNNIAWGKGNGVVVTPTTTANQSVSPDGTTTAARIVYPAVSGAGAFSFLYQSFAGTAASYAYSVWMKGSVGGEQLYLCTTDNITHYTAPRITLTTTWQRYTFITPTLSTAAWYFVLGTDLRDPAQASTTAQTIYAWGGQVETNYMSSYIPTTSSQVTRAADSLRYPIASVTGFSTTQGTLAHDYILEGTGQTYTGPAQFVGANNGADCIFPDGFTNVGQTRGDTPMLDAARIRAAGADQPGANFTSIPVPPNVIHRGAIAWRINTQTLDAHDGVGPTTLYGAATALPVITDLTINGLALYQNLISQWARRTRYWPRQLTQSELIAATTLDGPTLALDFMQPGQLDPRITFTRASSATYTDASGVVRTAASNAPRWDYKAGVLQGLLIEEQRTNLSFPSANWMADQPANASQDGVIQNVGPDPMGGNTAMAFIPGTYSGAHQWYTLQTGNPSTTYTFSVFAKPAGMDYLYMELGSNGFGAGTVAANFNLSAGTTGDPYTTIQKYPNGWYRCSITATSASGGVFPYVPNLRVSRDVTTVVTGNNVDGIWVFGHQFEVGAFPTSYIPTTGAAVLRAADVASMPTDATKWYSTLNGTVLAESLLPPNGNVGYRGIFTLDGGPFNAWLRSYITGGTSNVDGNIDVAPLGFGVMTPGTVFKCAATYSPAGSHCTLNGVMGAGSATVGTPSTWTTLRLGITDGANNNPANGYLRRLTYWSRAPSDTEMQQVTT
jgi:hypothetical protein